uniref:Uncharacterized protein n=1 Tax=Timema cristinae TaxID=61476 RepID=A0A7R9H4A9_TIMCR|nr:unnamed protein product [Timema cristinae]
MAKTLIALASCARANTTAHVEYFCIHSRLDVQSKLGHIRWWSNSHLTIGDINTQGHRLDGSSYRHRSFTEENFIMAILIYTVITMNKMNVYKCDPPEVIEANSNVMTMELIKSCHHSLVHLAFVYQRDINQELIIYPAFIIQFLTKLDIANNHNRYYHKVTSMIRYLSEISVYYYLSGISTYDTWTLVEIISSGLPVTRRYGFKSRPDAFLILLRHKATTESPVVVISTDDINTSITDFAFDSRVQCVWYVPSWPQPISDPVPLVFWPGHDIARSAAQYTHIEPAARLAG